ncbi:hypothetical protein GIB67_038841 [Kingdonia uniflora]|uniref:Bifunctional inhibitor/plant lipid transfer protein/seed storage helical domain-containing protein n=1 Tax=Kingdonia uniflora TaxID=39325 RepID=A0A7J7M0S6_9MAGN|nr:hypothetical protein GIB67_038841 [Kingdonia uniflora]
MRNQDVLLLLLVAISCFFSLNCSAATPTVEEQCNSEFTKMGTCLNFATAKADAPTPQCCSSVKDIKDRNPACLCYIIEQTHKGGASLKDLGLQEAKLLALPTACKLTGATISECPKLLKISPSSPDYAIFVNSSSTPAATSSPTIAAPATAKKDDTKSFGCIHGPQFAVPITIVVAIIGFVF